MFRKICFFAGGLFAATSMNALMAEDTPAPDFTTDQLTEAFGYVVALQSGFKELGFKAKDAPLIAKGLARALADKVPSPDMMSIIQSSAFQSFMEARISKAQAKVDVQSEVDAQANIDAGKVFIEGLKDDAGVQASESGLHYRILEAGDRARPTLNDTVLVHYKGSRIDGTPFDSSYDRGDPATFPLSGVVAGFGEGLTKIGAGGKIVLYIPSELGYGNNPRPGGVIQPGDTLVFECELLEINPDS